MSRPTFIPQEKIACLNSKDGSDNQFAEDHAFTYTWSGSVDRCAHYAKVAQRPGFCIQGFNCFLPPDDFDTVLADATASDTCDPTTGKGAQVMHVHIPCTCSCFVHTHTCAWGIRAGSVNAAACYSFLPQPTPSPLPDQPEENVTVTWDSESEILKIELDFDIPARSRVAMSFSSDSFPFT